METMTIKTETGGEALVAIVRETDKAILVKGNCSEAWFPKSALDTDGFVAEWFRFNLVHQFLFEAPYSPAEVAVC